jgi:hypothetical protein
MGKVVFRDGDTSKVVAVVTIETAVPEEGEDPISYPVVTESDNTLYWEDLLDQLIVLDDMGEELVWDDGDEYLKALPNEFRGAYTSAEYVE